MNSVNNERILALQGSQKGKRAWIVGNGPSLRRAPLRLLHEMGEHSFAVNRIATIFSETAWRPMYYSCVLMNIAAHGDNIDFIIDILTAIKNAPFAFLGEWLNAQVGNPKNAIWLKEYLPKQSGVRDPNRHPSYSRSITRGVSMARSLIVPVQLAEWMGYDPIILIGVDGKYDKSHINNHMVKEYVSVSDLSYEWDHERENDLQDQMHSIIRQSAPGVVNGTDGGVVENYPRVNPFEILGVKPPLQNSFW